LSHSPRSTGSFELVAVTHVLLRRVAGVLAWLAVEAFAEGREPVGVPRVGHHTLELREHYAHAGELRFGLPPGSDQAERGRSGPGEVSSCDRARGARARLPQPVGLDQRQRLRPVRGEEDDDEPGAFREADIALQPGDTQLQVGRRHDVQKPPCETDAKAGPVFRAAGGQACEARLHGLDGGLWRKQLFNLRFPQVERHGGVL
jgi:hypothetical protein